MAQPPGSLTYKISEPGQQLQMVVNSSRILEMDFEVPRVLVENPAVLKAKPISPTQIQMAAVKPGVTHLTLWDANGKVHSVDVVVIPDARELEFLLKTQFPEAALRVRPLSSSVAISGYCPSASMVSRVIAMAEDYYPKVINNIEIGGAQQVKLHVKVMEVSRTKLRTLGIDWALFANGTDVVSKPSGLILSEAIGAGQGGLTATGSTLSYGLVSGATSFFTYLEALRRNNLLKVLSEPTLTTVSGRAASFNVGGEFPILVPQSLGTVSIEYRQFGTRVDFVPIVRGNGEIRLEVRPQVSEIDASRSVTVQNTTIPGLRSRWVDTAAEMRTGQTLALAGLLQNRVESESRSVPLLGDLPWVGSAFRRVEESNNEVELLILVTPELVEPMDKHEVPPCGPGQFTRAPSDYEFYNYGWLEVPKCCNQCGKTGCKGNCGSAPGPGHGPAPAPANAMPYPTTEPNYVPGGEPVQFEGGMQAPAPVVTPGTAPVELVPQGGIPYGQAPVTTSKLPETRSQAGPYGGYTAAPILQPGDVPSTAAPRNVGYQPAAKAPSQAVNPTPGLIGPSGYDEIR
ncbi:MAG: pilus assembly protein N-terminal domain-containing protein [Planctomycetales bacterium]|nr:pilus assembly protein N-terminal domain-containing protein [Planctomycetales bacterium]